MTVKGIAEFLRKKGVPKMGRDDPAKEPDVNPLYLNQLKGKRVAVEASGIVYKQNWAAVCRAVESHSFVYVDGHGWSRPSPDEVLSIFRATFKSYMKRLCDSGIIPVVVLEGKAPDMKKDTVDGRASMRSGHESKVDALRGTSDLIQFKKHLMYTYSPGVQHMHVAMEVLKDLNIVTLRANHEAEGVCAHIVKDVSSPYHCDIAMIDDYDIFMYGCHLVIRNVRPADSKMGHFEATGYAFQDILRALFLSSDSDDGEIISVDEYRRAERQFRLLCILSGTDYSSNIPSFGPSNILKLMKKYNISTYAEICEVEPQFGNIPYKSIMKTLRDNCRYTVVHDDVGKVAPREKISTD